jgi:hypothetical protein
LGSSLNVTDFLGTKLSKRADLCYEREDSHEIVNRSEITVTPLFPVE